MKKEIQRGFIKLVFSAAAALATGFLYEAGRKAGRKSSWSPESAAVRKYLYDVRRAASRAGLDDS